MLSNQLIKFKMFIEGKIYWKSFRMFVWLPNYQQIFCYHINFVICIVHSYFHVAQTIHVLHEHNLVLIDSEELFY